MRLLAAINLLVSAVPATLAAVAGQAASANIAGKQLTANVAGKQLSIRPYSHVRRLSLPLAGQDRSTN